MKLSSRDEVIGGYFGLELNCNQNYLDEWGIAYQSARAALYAMLNHNKCQRIWLPKYICNSIIPAIEALGIEILRYDIDMTFRIKSEITLKVHDIVLYVNYFGICDAQEIELMSIFPTEKIIFDHSQAFFSKPKSVLATIYSPRKFLGVPDGGFLNTNEKISEQYQVDTGSVERAKHLLTRINDGAEAGYKDFKDADESLSDFIPMSMSNLTNRMLSAIDLVNVSKIRIDNFYYLHEKLGVLNELFIPQLSGAPLCYPLLIKSNKLRDILIRNKIFIAKYWADALDSVDNASDEYTLINDILAIPCDQRYRKSELNKVIALILSTSCIEL
jgi:hypothetical protein